MSKTPRKHAECIKAWADGSTIQIQINDDGLECWRDITGMPRFSAENEYRVKPAVGGIDSRDLAIARAVNHLVARAGGQPDEILFAIINGVKP